MGKLVCEVWAGWGVWGVCRLVWGLGSLMCEVWAGWCVGCDQAIM